METHGILDYVFGFITFGMRKVNVLWLDGCRRILTIGQRKLTFEKS